jgi:4-hydroxythreonine-4-phosphate dehydrogenase
MGTQDGQTKAGVPCQVGARIQADALLQALDLMDQGAADALVTLPVNKAQLKSAGMDHAGHTELFRARYPQSELVMSFCSDERWVGLVTDYIALY